MENYSPKIVSGISLLHSLFSSKLGENSSLQDVENSVSIPENDLVNIFFHSRVIQLKVCLWKF